jgi:hypothetical protein
LILHKVSAPLFSPHMNVIAVDASNKERVIDFRPTIYHGYLEGKLLVFVLMQLCFHTAIISYEIILVNHTVCLIPQNLKMCLDEMSVCVCLYLFIKQWCGLSYNMPMQCGILTVKRV